MSVNACESVCVVEEGLETVCLHCLLADEPHPWRVLLFKPVSTS